MQAAAPLEARRRIRTALVTAGITGFFRAEGLLAEMGPRDLVLLMLAAYAGGLAWGWRRCGRESA